MKLNIHYQPSHFPRFLVSAEAERNSDIFTAIQLTPANDCPAPMGREKGDLLAAICPPDNTDSLEIGPTLCTIECHKLLS